MLKNGGHPALTEGRGPEAWLAPHRTHLVPGLQEVTTPTAAQGTTGPPTSAGDTEMPDTTTAFQQRRCHSTLGATLGRAANLRTSVPPNLRTSESPNLRTSIPLYLLRTCELEEVRMKGQVHIAAGAGRVRAPPPESCHCAWRGPSAPPRWAGAHWCHGPAVRCALEGRRLRARTLLPGRSAWSPGA